MPLSSLRLEHYEGRDHHKHWSSCKSNLWHMKQPHGSERVKRALHIWRLHLVTWNGRNESKCEGCPLFQWNVGFGKLITEESVSWGMKTWRLSFFPVSLSSCTFLVSAFDRIIRVKCFFVSVCFQPFMVISVGYWHSKAVKLLYIVVDVCIVLGRKIGSLLKSWWLKICFKKILKGSSNVCLNYEVPSLNSPPATFWCNANNLKKCLLSWDQEICMLLVFVVDECKTV